MVICASETMVNGADAAPKRTRVALVNPLPLIVTAVPPAQVPCWGMRVPMPGAPKYLYWTAAEAPHELPKVGLSWESMVFGQSMRIWIGTESPGVPGGMVTVRLVSLAGPGQASWGASLSTNAPAAELPSQLQMPGGFRSPGNRVLVSMPLMVTWTKPRKPLPLRVIWPPPEGRPCDGVTASSCGRP